MWRRRRNARRGVVLLEFLIVAPMFFFLLWALLETGWVVYRHHVLSAATFEVAREAARRSGTVNTISASRELGMEMVRNATGLGYARNDQNVDTSVSFTFEPAARTSMCRYTGTTPPYITVRGSHRLRLLVPQMARPLLGSLADSFTHVTLRSYASVQCEVWRR